MKTITRCVAIEMITNHTMERIVKQTEIADFSALRDMIMYGYGGDICDLDNNELAKNLLEINNIHYNIVDEKVES